MTEVRSELQQDPEAVVAAKPSQDECTLAALAHASMVLNLVGGGFLGIVAAFFIWLTQKEKSAYVGFHALQALAFQIAVMAVTILGALIVALVWISGSLLTMVLVGCLVLPFAFILTIALLLVPFGGMIYGLVGAYETYYGRDFRYWLVADLVSRPRSAGSR
jgi:uncharacterized Tic20 family protein